MADKTKLTARDVLQSYMDEDLPDYFEIDLTDVNQRGHCGDTPIITASVRGIAMEVEALLAGGADVNAVGELGNTALHNAVGQGHVAVVRLLLEAGADPAIRNEFGYTAKGEAALTANEDIVAVLDWRENDGGGPD